MRRMTNADVLEKRNVTPPGDAFNCTLTYEVMNDPVIDPTTLNATALVWLAASPEEKAILDCGNFKDAPRYDRRWLIELMNDGVGTSPTTRLPFTKEQLIPDTELKAKIDRFMRPHRIAIIKSDAEAQMQYAFFQKWLPFSEKCAKESVKSLLTAALNAVEDLETIKGIVEKTDPKKLPRLLSTSGTATIKHLKHLDIQRTGTPLQMALYGDDEDVIAYLKSVMDPEEFERQSKEVLRNALSPEKQIELDALNAPLLDHYNAMRIAQAEAARELCHNAFASNVANREFTITNATIADFQRKITNYVKNNPIHNPYILDGLYEIYNKLPFDNQEKCLFLQKALGHAQALSPARWLQHYLYGIYYLVDDDDKPNRAHRSFACRVPGVADVRSLIPSALGVDFVIEMGGGVLNPQLECRLIERQSRNYCWKFLSGKNSKLSELITQPRTPMCCGCSVM